MKGAIVPAIPLPENASLEHLKNQAKLVQDLVRSGDDGGVDLVVEFHPRVGDRGAVPTPFKRADAQLVVARLYGFASWAALREHLRALDEFARPDVADNEPTGKVSRKSMGKRYTVISRNHVGSFEMPPVFCPTGQGVDPWKNGACTNRS